jgi:hypothetical protein
LKLVDLVIELLDVHHLLETLVGLPRQLIVKLLLLLNVAIDLSLFGEDLVRDWQTLSLTGLTFWISILNVMDDEATILSASKQIVVVKTDSHPLNWLGVCLNLADSIHLEGALGLILGDLVDDDGSWSVLLTDTAEECLTVVGHADLGTDGVGLIWLLLHIGVPDLAVITNAVDLILTAWNVYNTGHGNILLGEILLCISVGSLLDVEEVPEEDITTLASGDESHVILEPVDGSNFLDVTLALEVWWALIGVEVEHMGGTSSISGSKQVTSIGELDLTALLHLDVLEQVQTLGEDVHQEDLVLDGHDDVESTWVEGHSEGLLWQEL